MRLHLAALQQKQKQSRGLAVQDCILDLPRKEILQSV